MNRYCIVAGPRTGSHHLEDLIYNKLPTSQDSPAVKLGEFLHDFWISYIDKNGKVISEKMSIGSNERNNYISGVLTEIEKYKTKSFVMRIFILPFLIYDNKIDFNYIENIFKFLKNENFTFIELSRNRFDQLISLVVAKKTNFWLNYSKIPDKHDTKKILIGEKFFTNEFNYLKEQDEMTKRILFNSNIETIKIRYESLVSDCINSNIPIDDFSVYRKTYDISYEEIVENYDVLKKLFDKLKNG